MSEHFPDVLCLKALGTGNPMLIGARCQLRAGHDGECDPNPLPSLQGLTSVARQRLTEEADDSRSVPWDGGKSLEVGDEVEEKARRYDKLVRLLGLGWSINTEPYGPTAEGRVAFMLYKPGRQGVFARGLTLDEAIAEAPEA
jgi:hypothetical protein